MHQIICYHVHMRTTINIDDELYKQATKLTGIKEKTSLLNQGLQALISLEGARRLARMGGKMPGLKAPPRRR